MLLLTSASGSTYARLCHAPTTVATKHRVSVGGVWAFTLANHTPPAPIPRTPLAAESSGVNFSWGYPSVFGPGVLVRAGPKGNNCQGATPTPVRELTSVSEQGTDAFSGSRACGLSSLPVVLSGTVSKPRQCRLQGEGERERENLSMLVREGAGQKIYIDSTVFRSHI